MDISWIGAGTLATHGLTRLPGGVRAITRTPDRHASLRALGARPTTDRTVLEDGGHWVLSVPGSAAQAELVASLRHYHPKRAVFVSTIGFHAPYRGHITASSAPGTSDRAKSASAAENAFRAWMGERGVIVRLAGLHQRGRGPGAAFARKGTARLAPGNQPLPLISYEEAAELVVRCLLSPSPPSVVLGVSTAPTRRSFYRAAAARTGHPVPEFADDLADPPTFDVR